MVNLVVLNATTLFLERIVPCLIICKQVIFQCRNCNIRPSLSLLKVQLRYVYQLECSRAKQKDSLEIHQKKIERTAPYP